MENHTKITPPMGKKIDATPRYIVETPNQLWRVCSYDNSYPLYLSNDYPLREPHVFADLAVAKEALTCFWTQRGGAKLKIYAIGDDGQRVEVKS